MALTGEQTNALARHVIKMSQAKQAQTQQTAKQDAELMEAYRQLDGRLPSSTLDEGRLAANANLSQSIGQLPDNGNSQPHQQNAPLS